MLFDKYNAKEQELVVLRSQLNQRENYSQDLLSKKTGKFRKQKQKHRI